MDCSYLKVDVGCKIKDNHSTIHRANEALRVTHDSRLEEEIEEVLWVHWEQVWMGL